MSSRFHSHLSAGRFCKQLRAWSVVTLGLVSMSGVWAQGLTLGGISGQGLYFDGVNDTVNLNKPSSMNFSGSADFSLSLWVKPDYEQKQPLL